jgi:hypothetical protein
MHPISKPLRAVSQNLDYLRDFVDVLSSFVAEKRQESLAVHAPALELLSVALAKSNLGQEDRDQQDDVVMQHLLQKYPHIGAAELEYDKKGGMVKISFTSNEPQPHFNEGLQEILRAGRRSQMLNSSSLMNLTTTIELFFSELLHTYFELHPEAIGTKEKLFSFDDLGKFQTISDARAYYVSSKIEDLLRGSLADWLSFARNTIKLSMGYLKDDLELLEETFQRRNIVVHNGGRANSIYLSRVGEKSRSGVTVGDDLTPEKEYLTERIDLWEKTCVLIAAELWKQISPDDADRGSLLMELAYDHLLAKRWRVAEAISSFLIRDKQLSEGTHLASQLNYWQCRKRLGDWSHIRNEVEKADYAAKSSIYQLGHLALLDRVDDFYALVPRALSAGELSLDDLREFPIFEEMRRDQRFEQYRPAPPKKARRRRASASKPTDAVPSAGAPDPDAT